MYRIELTDEQRQEFARRTREPGISPVERARLEMVRLVDAGWSIPAVARHFGHHAQTVRRWVTRFLSGGFAALAESRHGRVESALTHEVVQALKDELAKGERIWTAAQIAEWLAEGHGVLLSVSRLRVHLRRARLSYKRTRRTLTHKQHPEQVAAKAADLATLEKGGKPGSWTRATRTRRALG